MALNIKNKKVEKLIEEIVEITGENKTEAILSALTERKERLAFRIHPQSRRQRQIDFLEREIWPKVPPAELGREMSKSEIETILGFGDDGV